VENGRDPSRCPLTSYSHSVGIDCCRLAATMIEIVSDGERGRQVRAHDRLNLLWLRAHFLSGAVDENPLYIRF
jgi:hypothetical protein